MSTYLEEQTMNSLYSLCNNSFKSNESYEDKIKILKSEKVLLNNVNYTNNKGIRPFIIENDQQNGVIITPSPVETMSERLNRFFTDGNYLMNVIILPGAGLVNGYSVSNIPTRISSERSITTKELLQKNIRSVNDQVDRDIIQFTSFNIVSDSIFVNPGDGSALVGKYFFYDSNDRLEVRYTGYQEQPDNIVNMLVLWDKSPNGTYFIRSDIANDKFESTEFTGAYTLTKIA